MRWGATLLAVVIGTMTLAPSARASWTLGADVGTAIPTSTFSEAWSSGFFAGISATYALNPKFAVGASIAHAGFGTTSDYQEFLEFIDPGAENDFSAWQYGIQGRYRLPLGSGTKLAPYAAVGVGLYSVKDTYDSPTNSDEVSETAFGLRGGLGCDYWMSPKLGIGLDASYHKPYTTEDEIGYGSTPFFTIAAGVRWRLSTSD